MRDVIPHSILSPASAAVNVLHINATFGTTSTGSLCADIQRAAPEFNAKVATAHSVIGPTGEFGGYLIGGLIDRKVHALQARLTGLQACGSLLPTRKLLNYIGKAGVNVIHLHNVHGNYLHLPSVLDFSVRQKIPIVISLHDCWFLTGKCTHYADVACDKWQSSCGRCPQLREDIPSWLFDRTSAMHRDKTAALLANPDLTLVAVSDWMERQARLSRLSRASSILRIYNWVDLEVFKPLPRLRKPDGVFTVLGVAPKWDDSKGLGRFLRLAKRLDEDEQIVLVGPLPTGVDLPDKIRAVGPVHDRSALAQFFNDADVFLNFSTEESFGKVTAESLASGTPVIAMDATANSELVPPECGILLKTEDEALSAIRSLKVADWDRSTECRKFAEQQFSMADNIASYFEVYRELAGKRAQALMLRGGEATDNS